MDQPTNFDYQSFFDLTTNNNHNISTNSSRPESNQYYNFNSSSLTNNHQIPFLDIDIQHLGSVDPLQTITPQFHPDHNSQFRTSSETDVFNTSQSTSHLINHPTNHLPTNSPQVLFPPISPTNSLSEHDHQIRSINLPSSPMLITNTTTSHHPINPHPNHHPPSSSTLRPKSPKSKPNSHLLPQDFKRRKDWQKKLVQDLMDVLQIISPTGELLFVSESMTRLTGFTTKELIGHQISNWCYDQEDRSNLEREIKNCFSTGSSGIINFYCRFKKKDSPSCVIFEILGHLITVKTDPGVLRAEDKNEKQVIIINARPYPTSCGRLTDEFLELMLENEVMMRVINGPTGVVETMMEEGREGSSSGSVSIGSSTSPSKALERSTGSASGITTVKNEAGEGERKKKAEEVDEKPEDDGHPQLARDSEAEEDLYLPLPAPPPPPTKTDPSELTHRPRGRGSNKRERIDFLCLDCGVTQSPEWRKGPMGRKTLCNACGLRYAKKAK